jgi:hypothetical protein
MISEPNSLLATPVCVEFQFLLLCGEPDLGR